MSRPPAPVLLGVAHGSRDPAAQDVVRTLLARVGELRPGLAARAAYLDNAAPSVPAAIDSLVREGQSAICVLPLLLTSASHSKTDVAAAVQAARIAHPAVDVSYGRPFGADPAVVAVLVRRLAGFDPDTPVVLVAGGSSDPAANAQVAAVARLVWEARGRRGPAVEVAFASTARPTVEQALARLSAEGRTAAVLARYFLGPGHLPAAVAAAAARTTGLTVETSDVLRDSDELARLVLRRYDEATWQQPVRMGCDGCLHRTVLPGRAAAVGLPMALRRHRDDAA